MNTNEDVTFFEEPDHNSPDLRELIFTYLSYWKWFLFSMILFVSLGYVYIKLTTPLYKIETDLLIKDNKASAGGQNDLLKDLDLFTSDKIIDNEIQILKSKTILEKVAKALKLETSYYSTTGVRKRQQYGNIPFEINLLKTSATTYESTLAVRLLSSKEAEVNGKKVLVNHPFQTEAGIFQIIVKPSLYGISKELLNVKFSDIADIIQQYSDNLKVDAASKQATVLVITLEDAIPQRGIDFLDRLVQEYNLAALEDKNKVTSRTLSFIDDRLSKLVEQLGSSEKNVEQYKSSNGIANIGTQSQILLQNVGNNDIELNKVLIQLSVLQNLETYLLNNNDQPSTLPSMLGIDDPTLLGLVQQLGETQQKRNALLQTVPETNPLVSSYTDQVKSLKEAIEASVQNFKKGLETKRKQLESKNSNFEGTIRHVPGQERGLLDVMRQQRLKDTLYMYLLQKREETAMQLASGVADSRTIDRARSSRFPIKPIKQMIYISFFLLGLLIPAVIIYLKNKLNFRVTRRMDIDRITKVPILAEISHSDSPGALIVSTKPRSMIAEQVRALRTNLQFVLTKKDQKVILFTSSISGEGKSFVSLNLGGSLAMAGNKVVILELDLRKPKLHAGLDIDNTLGLSNYLIGKTSYEQILKKIDLQENYYIITCGPIPPNPAELISNGKIGELIELLKEEFDYIILDAPPVGLVTDAQILGVLADTTIFIVRHNYTAKNYIQAIDHFYIGEKFPRMNIILNSVQQQHSYGYSYGYGYGYGYYEDDKPEKKSLVDKLLK